MRLILISVVVAISAVGCASTGSGAGAGGSKIQVVASFYPLAEVAARVGGGAVEVTNLTRPGAEPHDLEPTTAEVDKIQDAGLVIEMGRRFQPGVEAAAGHRRRGTTVQILEELPVGTGDVADEADPGKGVDPHVWLDPTKMRAIVSIVATRLHQLAPTPTVATAIDRRARAYEAALARLDASYEAGLKTCASRAIVTSHAAFGWLARRYDLDQHAITGLSPEQEPDPRRLAELVDLVRAKHLSTVFTETLVSPKVADALAREAGVKTAVLDPIEGISKKRLAAGDDYVSVMTANLGRLRAALRCS